MFQLLVLNKKCEVQINVLDILNSQTFLICNLSSETNTNKIVIFIKPKLHVNDSNIKLHSKRSFWAINVYSAFQVICCSCAHTHTQQNL